MSLAHSTIRAVAYYRKSNEDDGGSVEQQQQWANEQAPAANITIVREFIDQAVSGHDTGKRLGFHAMLEFCRAEHRKGSPIECVLCWHSNRFSRADSQETNWYIWEFRKVGVNRIFTAHGWTDFRKLNDRILYNLTQDTTNHQGNRDMAEATVRGHLKRAEQGLWNGGPAPYGYQVLAGKLVIDPETAPIVRGLFQAYADQDISLHALARDLNARGIPSPKGKHWSACTVRLILRNRKYLGHLPYGESVKAKFFCAFNLKIKERPQDNGKVRRKKDEDVYVKENTHEALITLEVFAKVQRKLVARTWRCTPRADGGAYLLSGLLECGHCGHSMVGAPRRGKKIYYCSGYNHYRRALCTYNKIEENALLKALTRKIRQEFLDPEKLAQLRQEIRRQDEEESLGDTALVGRLQARRDELDRKIKVGYARMMEEESQELVAVHRQHVLDLLAQKKAVQSQLDALARPRLKSFADLEDSVNRALAQLDRLLAVFKEGNPARVRAAIGEVVAKVELFFNREDHGRLTYCTFAKALIYLREDFGLSDLEIPTGRT
jgi:site-specific DNA recombinase